MRRVAVVVVAAACTVSSGEKSFDVPSSDGFRYVSDMLGARCGSLDCHGQAGRNLRLYSRFGLRLAGDDVPGRGQTTAAEHEANYASVVMGEPELLSQVFGDGGRDPQRLTLVRKARYQESHKGGRAVDAYGDRCIVSWLEGEIDKKACFAASILQKPQGFGTAGGSGGASTGGAGGQGGLAGSPSGGASGMGGAAIGGAGGTLASGGTTGSGGYACGMDFWPCALDVYAECSAAKPSPPGHQVYAKADCQSCHGATGPGQEFLFSGVVWSHDTKAGAEHVQVAVKSGADFFLTCSDQLGFFFVSTAGQPAPDWPKAETHIRAVLGEKIMPADKEHKPSCNSSDCHAHAEHTLWAP